jgi:hypothetical protein
MVPVARFLMDTLTLGTLAAEGSEITPDSVAPTTWAKVGRGKIENVIASTKTEKHVFVEFK